MIKRAYPAVRAPVPASACSPASASNGFAAAKIGIDGAIDLGHVELRSPRGQASVCHESPTTASRPSGRSEYVDVESAT